jgi:4-hydroxy-tetrahydrodipicolinate reductase
MPDMKLAVVGAGGRMGRALIRAICEADGTVLSAAIARSGNAVLGEDAGTLVGLPPLGVPVTDDVLTAFAAADGVIDFTLPSATPRFADLAAQARIVHVIGTTGLSGADIERLDAAARHAVLVRSGNMSLGVNLLAALTRKVAATLGADFDIEIVEMHHRHKVDAPSGTALLLGEAAARGRHVPLADAAVRVRDGHTGPRVTGAIGFATLRGGSVVGDHTVIFAGAGERVELAHKADDRMIYARGAVRAALWGRSQTPGHYTMADVLGIADL